MHQLMSFVLTSSEGKVHSVSYAADPPPTASLTSQKPLLSQLLLPCSLDSFFVVNVLQYF